MRSFFENMKGSISIFLILILFPMYTCAYLAIDSARYMAAVHKTAGAISLVGNAAMADYDADLKELYGLFAMSQDENALTGKLVDYFSSMIDKAGLDMIDTSFTENLIQNVKESSGAYENTIDTITRDLKISYDTDSCLANPEVLRKYIRNYMKYRAPYSFTEGFLQKIGVFSQLDKISNVLDKSNEYYSKLEKSEEVIHSISTVMPNPQDTSKEELQSNLQKVLNMIPNLKASLKDTQTIADKWGNAIHLLEEGEVKSLLYSDFNNSAYVLSDKSLEDFEKVIRRDLEMLAAGSEIDSDASTTNFEYALHPVYRYLNERYIANLDDQTVTEAENTKQNLEKLSKTDISALSQSENNIQVLNLVKDNVMNYLESQNMQDDTDSGISWNGLSECIREAVLYSYESEYITEMFSCSSSRPSDQSLTGTSFSDFPLFGGEVEYIIFGKNSLNANKTLAVNMVLAIRILMNTIYVFSNPQMRQSALAVAVSLAGWSGMGVSLTQNLLMLAWGISESILDVSSLCRGNAVPIYKSANTWTLSLNGLAGVLSSDVKDYACKTVDDVFSNIRNAADNGMEEIRSASLSYINRTAQGVTESLTAMIVTPIASKITLIVSGLAVNYSRSDIEKLIIDTLEKTDNNSSGFLMAKKLFYDYCLSEIVDKIYGYLPSVFSEDKSIAEGAAATIQNAINDLYNSLFSKISEKIMEYEVQAKEKLDGILRTASKNTKEKAIGVIDDYTKNIYVLLGDSTASNSSGSRSVSGYSGMGITYKEYMKIFVLMKMAGKQSRINMLKRVAMVMQINLSCKKPTFDITKVYTAVNVYSQVNIGLHKIKQNEVFGY